MNKAVLLENKDKKILKSENYNFIFDKKTGFFARWGKTQDDDPQYSPVGPEIADIEISTICKGVEGVGVCKFCYKGNTPRGENMSLETFKKLFHKLPKHLTQIAFGIGDIDSNPDMWAIFDYAKANNAIPNVTVNGEGITDEIADRLAKTCGAVAVSLYDKDKTFDTIKKLTDRGMTQVNIHFMISEETYDMAMDLINDRINDLRIEKLNAIVFLSLKPKGRAISNNFTKLPQEKFSKLIKKADDAGISYGMDSCSAAKYIKTLKENPNKDKLMEMVEGCESTRFSLYVNTNGKFFPCSFMDGEKVDNGGDWTEGMDVVNCEDFLKDVWHNEKTRKFREKCISCVESLNSCPHYDI